MTTQIPVSLLDVHDLMTRFPDRTAEIIDHAIHARERELILLRESKNLISWRVVQTMKAVVIAGLIAFSLSFILSEVSSFGRLYSETKNAGITIPVPVIGDQTFTLQNIVPTSTALETASKIPAYGLRGSIYFGIAAMITVLVERFVTWVFQRRKIHVLRGAEKELLSEIHQLKEWKI